MKVYFACSIRGGGDTSNYIAILDVIKAADGEVLSEIFVHDAIRLGGSPLPSDQIYQRDIAMIQDVDIVIAEVTNPSLGVGYELAYAESLGKPTLTLFDGHSEKRLSAMIEGNPAITNATYSSANSLDCHITSFISSVSRHSRATT